MPAALSPRMAKKLLLAVTGLISTAVIPACLIGNPFPQPGDPDADPCPDAGQSPDASGAPDSAVALPDAARWPDAATAAPFAQLDAQPCHAGAPDAGFYPDGAVDPDASHGVPDATPPWPDAAPAVKP